MDDVFLQHAIYSSLRMQFEFSSLRHQPHHHSTTATMARAPMMTTRPHQHQPPPQRRSTTTTTTSSSSPLLLLQPPPIRQQQQPQPSVASNGVRSTLAREGILPAAPSNTTTKRNAITTTTTTSTSRGKQLKEAASSSTTDSQGGGLPPASRTGSQRVTNASGRVGGGGGGARPPPPPAPAKMETGPRRAGATTTAASTATTTTTGATTLSLPPSIDPLLAQHIEAEMLDRNPCVQWEDIAGMEEAKQIVKEAIVLPLLVPELFTETLKPWKGVLLYGPPGTGKTMLAKAVATCSHTTFFHISSSVITSKHFGESEKLVRALFAVARHYSPSTIFFDEVDAIMGERKDGEHDVMRRIKTELLQQMDGLNSSAGDASASSSSSTSQQQQVTVLAATNRPWDLDEAMRRRLEKRVYIPLPNEKDREAMLRLATKDMLLDPSVDLAEVAAEMERFSGADVVQVVRGAAMEPLRRLLKDKSPQEIAEMRERKELVRSAVTALDFRAALEKTLPSVAVESLAQHEAWGKSFGST